jgi:hypothetical protein
VTEWASVDLLSLVPENERSEWRDASFKRIALQLCEAQGLPQDHTARLTNQLRAEFLRLHGDGLSVVDALRQIDEKLAKTVARNP